MMRDTKIISFRSLTISIKTKAILLKIIRIKKSSYSFDNFHISNHKFEDYIVVTNIMYSIFDLVLI